jgi:beta-hydroxylase
VRERAVTIATELGGKALHSTESWVLKHSIVPTTPFLPDDTFPWVKRVEENVADVQAELEEVLSYRDDLPNFQDISVDQASISNDDGWKTFFFLGYGFRSEANCRRCPKTAALLDSIPGCSRSCRQESTYRRTGAHGAVSCATTWRSRSQSQPPPRA